MVFLPHWPTFRGTMPMDLRLERIVPALEILGHPHKKLPPVIHVAGTNGKGSTSAFMKAMLEAGRYKVHSYTSPHLLDFNERIYLAGKHISDEDLYTLMEYCRVRLESCDITYFEATTVAAMYAFSQTPADIVILETGMGGRLDATNVIEKPVLTVITPISLDHTEFLGSDIYTIAGEKAGIMKKGVPCVISMQHEDAMKRLHEESEQRSAPSFAFEYDWGIAPGENSNEFYFTSADTRIAFQRPQLLPGNHQVMNGCTAVAAAFLLRDRGFPALTDEVIARGVASAQWPGRLQRLDKGYVPTSLPTGWAVVLDGAHNPAGALILADYIASLPKEMPIYLAAGQTRGRDRGAFLAPLAKTGRISYVFGTSVFTEPSAYHGSLIAEAATNAGIPSGAYDSFDDVLSFIAESDLPPGLLLCCGSLYLLSDILRLNKGDPIY